MMQASTLQTNAPDLLSLLFGGMLGDGVSLGSLDGASFLSAFGDQLKELLLKQGADPGEVAAMDGQALVAQFLLMMQGQPPTAELPRNDTLSGNSAFDVGPGGRADAMAMLRQLLVEAVDGSEQADTASGETKEEDGSAFLKAIPSDLLDQLVSSSSLADLAEMAGISNSGTGSSNSSRSPTMMQFDELSFEAGTDPEATDIQFAELNAVVEALRENDDPSPNDLEPFQSDTGQSSDDAGLTLLGMGHVGSTLAATAGSAQRSQVFDLATLLQAGGEKKFVDEVRWIIDGNAGTAELKLHPPSLGELDVRVRTDAEKTSIQFISPHPIVREVLEAALPRLRDSLIQDGVNLGSVTVTDQSPHGRGDAGQEQGQAPRHTQGPAGEADTPEESVPIGSTMSILARRHDYFA